MNNLRPLENFTPELIYEEYFDTSKLSQEEIDAYKNNNFIEEYSTGLAIFLHFITLGIFTIFFCGSKYSRLPLLKNNDFMAGKAIGFLFIPYFNLYWLFIYWRHLVMRMNLQLKLWQADLKISFGLATAVAVCSVVPYIGWAANYLVLGPLLLSQIQNAHNELAKKNLLDQSFD